jgi:hypothetical protein
VACVMALLVMACHLKGERRAHDLVGSGGETLRAAFNSDVDKVRVLALVSPT